MAKTQGKKGTSAGSAPKGRAAAPKTAKSPSGAGATHPFVILSPPEVSAPKPPTGFVPAKPGTARRNTPLRAAMMAVPDVVAELRACTEYNAIFGRSAPPAERVAATLAAARAWSSALAAADAWRAYLNDGATRAWEEAAPLMASLSRPYFSAVALDPDVQKLLPSLAIYFGAAANRSRRAAVTVKRKREAKAKAEAKARGAVGAKATQKAP